MKIVEGLPPKTTQPVAIDLEIFGANSRQLHRPAGTLALMSISNGETTWLLEKASQVEMALERLANAPLIFHNASFDVRHLRRWGYVPPRSAHLFRDTLLLERILFGGWYDEFDLAALARRYLQQVMSKEVRKKFEGGEIVTQDMKDYAALDAYTTWHIHNEQMKHPLMADAWKVWERIDAPAFWATLDFRGFKIDRKRWLALAEANQTKAEEIASTLGFNPGSPVQVKAALLKRRIRVENTRELSLQEFADDPVVQQILAYREAAKRASTYGSSFIKDFVEEDDRVYSEYVTVKAETGRMASSGPNMQNQPREATYRSCFIVDAKNSLLIADYSQQEPRIAAALSGDVELLRAFESGEDVHLTAARAIYHDPDMKKDDPRRKIAKSLNLGLTYGLTASGLSTRTGLPLDECEKLVKNYFHRFAGLKRWIDGSRKEASRLGYVSTVSGRKVWMNPYSRQWMNNAINAPIQGSAADVTKLALANLHLAHKKDSDNFPVVGVVHDEIILEVPTKEVKPKSKLLVACMESAFESLVPQVSRRGLVDVSVGKNWADKH